MGFWDTLANIGSFGLYGAIKDSGDSKDKAGNDATAATNNGTFGPGGYKVGDIAYEGLSPKQDSITQYFRSFENAQAQSGQEKTATGQQGYGTGVGQLDKSYSDLQPAVDYFTKLLGGDRATVTSAVQPQVDQIGQQFDQARSMLSLNPRGGGKASSQAKSQTDQIAQITNLINQARGNAATGLTSATGQESSTAQARAGLGLQESGLGFQDLQSAIQSVESRKGFNVQESGANKQMATSLFSSLV